MEYVRLHAKGTANSDCITTALDYPPFFAYFEKLLSIPAYFIDPKIVDRYNLNYDAWSVIAYQRTTVILTELVLGAAVHRYAGSARIACFTLRSFQIHPRVH